MNSSVSSKKYFGLLVSLTMSLSRCCSSLLAFVSSVLLTLNHVSWTLNSSVASVEFFCSLSCGRYRSSTVVILVSAQCFCTELNLWSTNIAFSSLTDHNKSNFPALFVSYSNFKCQKRTIKGFIVGILLVLWTCGWKVHQTRDIAVCHRDKLKSKFDIIHLFFYIIKLKNKNCCKLRDIDKIETNCTSDNYLLEQFYLYQHGQIKTRVKD